MMNKAQFYTNRQEYSGGCPQIPTRPTNFLDKNNCLSEFLTPTDKEAARANLGIPDIVRDLNQKIDAKVIERGGVAWDAQPTEGSTEKVLSSNTMYNVLLRYALRSELDNSIQQVWSDTVNKISENYNRIEIEINELNTSLREYVDEVRCEFNNYTTYINQQFASFKEQVLQQYDQMQASVTQLEAFVNETVASLTNTVNNQLQQFGQNVDATIASIRQEMSELSNQVDTKITNLENYIASESSRINTEINQRIQNSEQRVNTAIQNLENEVNTQVQNLEDFVNTKDQQLETFVNQKVDEMTQQNNDLIRRNNEMSDNLLYHLAELKKFVQEEHLTLYDSVYSNLNTDKIVPLEQRMDQLQLLVDTFLQTSGGTALTNQFGNDEYIGVNQKTLTNALNKLWDKIEEITGEITQGINMIVTPSYFISEDGCTVNISASSSEANGIFEHIAFYADGNLIAEADNVESFNTQTHIDDTTEIKCVAKIMGIEYTKSKTVTHYNSFFLFAGSFETEEAAIEYATGHPEYSRPITSGLRGAYDITCNQGDNIIVIFGKSFASGFLRADLNSIEIPFTQKVVTINDEEYVVFVSTNTYNAETYNIDING